MSKRLFTFLLVGMLVATTAPAAFGVCQAVTTTQIVVKGGTPGTSSDPVSAATQTFVTGATPLLQPITGTVPGPPVAGVNDAGTIAAVSLENVYARVSDVLVYDDGVAPSCFQANQTIRITYNATITQPNLTATPFTSAPVSNFDTYDSAGSAGLVITAASQVGLAAGQNPQTVVTVTVLQAGTAGNPLTTATGSAFRIKNMYADASASAAPGPTPLTVTVSDTIPGAGISVNGPTSFAASATPNVVANASNLIVGGPSAFTTSGAANQSSAGALSVSGNEATFTIGENPALTSGFRVAQTAGQFILNDVANNATDLIFDIGPAGTIPSGVTVTFPTTITISGTTAPGPLTDVQFTLFSGGTCSSTTTCVAMYHTTYNDAGGPFALTFNTAAAPGSGAVTAGAISTNPKIGVVLGSTTGFGTVPLHVFFGPTRTADALDTADDVIAGSIPAYVSNSQPVVGTAKTRNIFKTTNFFTINAVRTTLLFPFATTAFGYDTGLSVANTCGDAGVFGAAATCAQTGGIKFWFFPTGGAAFTLNTDTTAGGTDASSACRGLSATGQLAPGGIAACDVKTLIALVPGAPATFDGYVIAVASFTHAHGFSVQFTPAGPYAANSALVLGAGARTAGFETLTQ